MTNSEKAKRIILAGATVGMVLSFFCVAQNQQPVTHSANIFVTNDNIKITQSEASFNNLENVLVEKIAIDPRLVFEEKNDQMYISIPSVELKDGPYDDCTTLATINMYDSITLIGENEYEYSKIIYNGNEYFIKDDSFGADLSKIFKSIDAKTEYVSENGIEVKELPDDTSTTVKTLDKFTELSVVGTNEYSDYLMVSLDSGTYYVKNNILTENRDTIFSDMNTTMYAKKSVKLLSTPGGEDSYDKLKINSEANVIGENNEYYKVIFNNYTGYIAKDYLSTEKIEINHHTAQSGDTVTAQFTAYCSTDAGCTNYDAMGNYLNPSNNTCAAPSNIPFGTKIQIGGTGTYLDGQIFTVTDRGGAIKVRSDGTYVFDILMSNTGECNQFGRQNGYAIIVE